MESNKSELEILIKNLCVVIHTELANISKEVQPSTNLNSLLSLSSSQALEFISSTITKAIQFKDKSKRDSIYQEFLNDELYQKEMQKLENEIRNHIKTEQQMKIYSDALEEKNEKLATKLKDLKKSNSEKLELIKQENKQIRSKILMIQKEITEIKKEEKTIPRVLSRSRLSCNSKQTDIDKKILKADFEHAVVAKTLQDTEKEFIQQKKDNEELKGLLKEFVGNTVEKQKEKGIVYMKKFEEKSLEVEGLKKKLKVLEIGVKKTARSITPTLAKGIQVQSQKIIKKNPSNEKLKTMRVEKFVTRTETSEKKILPLSFTARK